MSTRSQLLTEILLQVNKAANVKLQELERHRQVHPFKRRERKVLRREYQSLDAAYWEISKMINTERTGPVGRVSVLAVSLILRATDQERRP